MVDWLSLKIPITHKEIIGTKTIRVDSDNVVLSIATSGIHSVGSFDSSVYLATYGSNLDGSGSVLYFSGNPSKFLQGHNVFGINNPLVLMYKTLLFIQSNVDLGIDISLLKVSLLLSEVTRIDINQSFNVGSIQRVRSFIQALEFKARTRHGKSQLTGNTLYFGKNSKRWSIKIYSKFDELKSRSKKHYLDVKLFTEKQINLLEDFAEKTIRIELTLRKEELLKNKVVCLQDLTNKKNEKMYENYIRKIEMSEQLKINDDQLYGEVPQFVRGTYLLWRDGYDVRRSLTKSAYYRHKKALNKFNIDIAIKRDTEQVFDNIMPLLTIIEAKPVGVPDFAYSEDLIVNENQLDLFISPPLSIV
jgi:II/X family phage/plasmid replication protein